MESYRRERLRPRHDLRDLRPRSLGQVGWMREHKLGRKRLLDILLAATYYIAGVRRLATTDWRDFARYGVFDLERL